MITFAAQSTPVKTAYGFSLTELSVVLVIIGLVIGGIWAASRAVREQQKANETIAHIVTAAEKVRALYSGQEWNVPFNSNDPFTNAQIIAMGLVPPDWIKGNAMVSPYGANVSWSNQLVRGNWGSGMGESIGITIAGREGGYTSGATQQDCNRLIRASAARMRENKFFIKVQVAQNDAPHQQYLAPIDPSTISCPADFNSIFFWFTR